MRGPGPPWAVMGDAGTDLRMTKGSLPLCWAVLGVLMSPALAAVLPAAKGENTVVNLPNKSALKILPNKSALLKSACNLVVETILSPPRYCGFPRSASWGF